jgi:TonB family protein
MRIALALASWAIVTGAVTTALAQRSRGLSLEQIRSVMRANSSAFSACHKAAARQRKRLYGPFVYQIEVDQRGKVKSVRPYQPSAVASFDRCVVDVIKRVRFPGGPASVEAPLVFEPS